MSETSRSGTCDLVRDWASRLGKSVYGVRSIARHLLKGGVVATNIELLPGWVDEVLSHAPFFRVTHDPEKREEMRLELASRYLYERDIEVLMATKAFGKGEGRGLMVIDEAHNEIGNRRMQAKDMTQALKKLSLSRHRGFDILIVTQDMDNTDVAARRLSGLEIRLINWKHWARIPVIDFKLLPRPIFLAQTFPTKKLQDIKNPAKRLKFEMFLVSWYGKLFDTFQDYELDDELEDEFVRHWLPLSREEAAEVLAISRGEIRDLAALSAGGA